MATTSRPPRAVGRPGGDRARATTAAAAASHPAGSGHEVTAGEGS